MFSFYRKKKFLSVNLILVFLLKNTRGEHSEFMGVLKYIYFKSITTPNLGEIKISIRMDRGSTCL